MTHCVMKFDLANIRTHTSNIMKALHCQNKHWFVLFWNVLVRGPASSLWSLHTCSALGIAALWRSKQKVPEYSQSQSRCGPWLERSADSHCWIKVMTHKLSVFGSFPKATVCFWGGHSLFPHSCGIILFKNHMFTF